MARNNIEAYQSNLATDGVAGSANAITRTPFGLGKEGLDVSIGDMSGTVGDAFGRLRVSPPSGIFDNKNVLDRNEYEFAELTASGGSITYLPNESSVSLAVGTTSGAYAIRQSIKRIPYSPGRSQFITMTGVLGAAKANLVTRLGYFDDDNGIFFQVSSAGLAIVLRSRVSGSVNDTVIPQASWNVDRLDGTGSSGMNFNPANAQIFNFDFQWLGVGRIRFGVNFNGRNITCHEIMNANNVTAVYMTTPTLPVRYEIRNTGTTASSSSMKEICASASAEGGYNLPGVSHTAHGTAVRTLSITNTPMFAIRLKNSYNSVANRKIIRVLETIFTASSGTAIIEICKVFTPTTSTATWTDVGTDSGVEYSTDISAVTGSRIRPYRSILVPAGLGSSSNAVLESLSYSTENAFLYQNAASNDSQMCVVFARSLTGAVDLLTAMTWIEFV